MNLHCVLACPIATGRFSKRIDLFKSLRYPEGPGALTAVVIDLLKKKGGGGGWLEETPFSYLIRISF